MQPPPLTTATNDPARAGQARLHPFVAMAAQVTSRNAGAADRLGTGQALAVLATRVRPCVASFGGYPIEGDVMAVKLGVLALLEAKAGRGNDLAAFLQAGR